MIVTDAPHMGAAARPVVTDDIVHKLASAIVMFDRVERVPHKDVREALEAALNVPSAPARDGWAEALAVCEAEIASRQGAEGDGEVWREAAQEIKYKILRARDAAISRGAAAWPDAASPLPMVMHCGTCGAGTQSKIDACMRSDCDALATVKRDARIAPQPDLAALADEAADQGEKIATTSQLILSLREFVERTSRALRALAAELSALRAAAEWRPISEAPRDGTAVLVFAKVVGPKRWHDDAKGIDPFQCVTS